MIKWASRTRTTKSFSSFYIVWMQGKLTCVPSQELMFLSTSTTYITCSRGPHLGMVMVLQTSAGHCSEWDPVQNAVPSSSVGLPYPVCCQLPDARPLTLPASQHPLLEAVQICSHQTPVDYLQILHLRLPPPGWGKVLLWAWTTERYCTSWCSIIVHFLAWLCTRAGSTSRAGRKALSASQVRASVKSARLRSRTLPSSSVPGRPQMSAIALLHIQRFTCSVQVT